MRAPVCPECAVEKHGNCDGRTLDQVTDEITYCGCPCRVDVAPATFDLPETPSPAVTMPMRRKVGFPKGLSAPVSMPRRGGHHIVMDEIKDAFRLIDAADRRRHELIEEIERAVREAERLACGVVVQERVGKSPRIFPCRYIGPHTVALVKPLPPIEMGPALYPEVDDILTRLLKQRQSEILNEYLARESSIADAVRAGEPYTFVSESELQEGLHQALLAAFGPAVKREYRLGEHDRPDFMVGNVAIEVKTKGSVTEVSRQLMRYAAHAEVNRVVLVTTRSIHRQVEGMLRGVAPKPVFVVILTGGAL